MACNLTTLRTAACTSGIGRLLGRIPLLRVWAQLLCGALAAPVLFKDGAPGPNFIKWTWTGTDPTTWAVEGSDYATGPFVVEASPPGSARQLNGAAAWAFWRIRGLDSGGTPVTAYSNVLPD